MKLFVETLPSAGIVRVSKSSDGQVHVSLTGNGTFIQMTPDEARALADNLRAAADQREVA